MRKGDFYPLYPEQNNLDRNSESNVDHYLDCVPEDGAVYMGHSLFNITKSVTVVFILQPLFDGPEITIQPISGLKLSRSQSRREFIRDKIS